MAGRSVGGTSLNTYPRFDTWKFQDSFANPRGSLNSFNLDRYVGKVFVDPAVSGPPVPGGGPYVGDKGTKFTPHERDIADPRLKDDNIFSFADPPKVNKAPAHRAISGLLASVLPPKPVNKRRPSGRMGGISLASQAGGMGRGGGIESNPYYRNTPGTQTYGIYPQTGAQQDYSLHNPNSYTYSPAR
jgi:hypothetical protein